MTGPVTSPRGVALISALVVMTVVVSVAVSVAARQSAATAQVAGLLGFDYARLAVAELEAQAAITIGEVRESVGKEAFDDGPLAQPVTVETATGKAHGQLFDLQARFNLNNMVADVRAGGGAAAGPAARASNVAGSSTASSGAAESTAAADGGGSALGNALWDTATEDVGLVDEDHDDFYSYWPGVAELQAEQRLGDSGAGGADAGAATTASAASGEAGATVAASAATGADEDFDDGVQEPTAVVGDATGAGLASGANRTRVPPWRIAEAQFRLLLTNLEIDEEIVQAILDWIDPNSDPRFPNGAEDEYYVELQRPYRTANRPLAHISELQLIKGITDEVYAKLKPYVMVLPLATAINVNSADADVLMTLGPGIDRSTANLLIESREVQRFLSPTDFLSHPLLMGRPLISRNVTIWSDYYLLSSVTDAGAGQMFTRSTLKTSSNFSTSVIRRESGFAEQ